MKIIHVSQTPVAGAAWAAAESMREAGHKSISITRNAYSDGRRMPIHEPFPPQGETLERVRQADVLVAHQGHPVRYDWWPRNVPTVAVYHSEPSHIWRKVEGICPWAVIGQDMADMYENPRIVPNLVPLDHRWFTPATKPKDKVRIVYAPSNRKLTGRNDKGYSQTVEALGLVECEGVEVDIIEGTPLMECLQRKSTAHICIDECVVGYHRSSLEGLALGCVVLNACYGSNEDRLLEMSGAPSTPFIYHKLDDVGRFAEVLGDLAALGSQRLESMGRESRWWMEEYWNSKRLLNRCWMPLIGDALA